MDCKNNRVNFFFVSLLCITPPSISRNIRKFREWLFAKACVGCAVLTDYKIEKTEFDIKVGYQATLKLIQLSTCKGETTEHKNDDDESQNRDA